MKNNYVVKIDDLFWTGAKFSPEYPEAKLYTRFPGQKELDWIAHEANEMGWNGCSLDVIQNYGFENQETFDGPVSDEVLAEGR